MNGERIYCPICPNGRERKTALDLIDKLTNEYRCPVSNCQTRYTLRYTSYTSQGERILVTQKNGKETEYPVH